ncbi:hypothetical protein DEO72_LG4g937 [Vigna unguiculata]|uniref:Uncharacterized protein n=1 Tax=Vigna unguiculata TaxID=3917 RepID=A0A4D6LNN7_VIGUN|nr:hypothetical protein DEO72_LG4g937 [Vigna unguiculata]
MTNGEKTKVANKKTFKRERDKSEKRLKPGRRGALIVECLYHKVSLKDVGFDVNKDIYEDRMDVDDTTIEKAEDKMAMIENVRDEDGVGYGFDEETMMNMM